MLERVVDLADGDLPRAHGRRQLEHAQGLHDGRVDRELVDVDLGEDRVEVHEGARVGDLERQDAVDLGVGVPEHVLRHDVDRGRLRALRDAHGDGVLVDVQHVAALGMERGVAAEVQRRVLVVGMVLEKVLAVDGLAVARGGVHAVEVHAVSDDGERVAREVQVGHRVDGEVGLALDARHRVERQRAHERQVDLVFGEARHGLLHELAVVDDGAQALADGGGQDLALDAGLGEVLVQELLAGGGHGVERFGDEVLEVDDLDPLVAQGLGERVVLGLRVLQKRDVLEQEPAELARRKIEQLVARPVQADTPKLPDLVRDMQTFRHRPTLSVRAAAQPSRARVRRRRFSTHNLFNYLTSFRTRPNLG